MSSCAQLLTLFLLTTMQVEGTFPKKGIKPTDIKMKIKKKKNFLNVTWNNPNKEIDRQCYKSNLQYKSHCDLDWQNFELKSFNFPVQLPMINIRKNYTFRLRMKYDCLNHNWSLWTSEQHWWTGDKLDHCFGIDTGPNTKYIEIIVIPVIFLLLLLAAQKKIRRLFLPKVPDPKHIYKDLLEMDQSQLDRTFKDPDVECTAMKIQIVHIEREEVEQRDEPADPGHGKMTVLTSNTEMKEGTWPADSPTHTVEHSGYVCW